MASINLPNEMVVAVAEKLESIKDRNAFARSNRHLYAALNRHIYLTALSNFGHDELYWAARQGRSRTIEIFIEVGALHGTNAAKDIESLLYIAALRGYADIVKILMDHGADTCEDMNRYCQISLGEALKGNQPAVAEVLVNSGRADIEGTLPDEQKAIHLAARADSGSIIKFLFDRGVDLYALDQSNASALQIAATEAKLSAVDALLECGFDPNFIDGNGNAPIHGLRKAYKGKPLNVHEVWGCLDNKRTLTRTLLNYGADPYLKDRYGVTPLWLASYLGLGYEVEALLEHGINPDGLDQNGNPQQLLSPDEFAQMKEKNLSLKFTFKDYTSVRVESNFSTPLCLAALHGHGSVISLLLKYGANPNVLDQNGLMPLHSAVLGQRADLACILIKNGASINAKDADGQTPLRLALKSGGINLVETLLEQGASIDNIDSTGIHPIFRALEYGHSNEGRTALLPPEIVDTGKEFTFSYQNDWPHRCYCCANYGEDHECDRVVEWFLGRGTDVNTRDSLGRSMLHQAVFQNCKGSVTLLLRKGADPMATDLFGQIPLHMACSDKWKYESHKVFKILLDAGCDPNAKDMNGDTSLHMAARSSFAWGVRMFRLDGRADFLARNNLGNTPCHEGIGRDMSDEETIIELRRAGTDLNLVNNDGKTVWDLAKRDPEWEDYLTGALECPLPEEEDESDSSSERDDSSGDEQEDEGDSSSESDESESSESEEEDSE